MWNQSLCKLQGKKKSLHTNGSNSEHNTPPCELSRSLIVCFLVGCLTSLQHASVSQGRICSDNCTCCHTEIQVADQTFHLTQSQYIDTEPTSPSTDPRTQGAWQGSHWSHSYDSTPEKSRRKRDSNPGSSTLEPDALTTRTTMRSRSLNTDPVNISV